MAQMSDDTLKGICESKLNNTLGWIGGTLQKERQKALQFYRGDPFGNEQEGRSQVVSRDVAEAIDQTIPPLMKVFASTDTYVAFSARRPEQEEAARQKTDYCNWVFQTQPNSFNLIQVCLKDGLLSKMGVYKSYWEETEEKTPEEYEGLTREQYLMLLADPNVEEVECSERSPTQQETQEESPQAQPQTLGPFPPTAGPGQLPQTPANFPGMAPQQPPQAPQPQPQAPPQPDILYDCKINRTNKKGRVCIEVIPPEEFLVERRTVSLDTTTFAAHRASRTKSDLIQMGFSKAKVKALPDGTDALEINVEKVNRFAQEDDLSYVATNNLDPAMSKVWVAECYIKVDYDGDGVAEWRKVTLAGDGGYEILDNETCDGHPFTAWSPYLQPHKLIGDSMADKTMDIQLIKSTVWRENMDALYFNSAPQLVVLEGQANMEDVLTRRPGGVIRLTSANAVEPLPVVDTSQSGMQMISYLDSVKEMRTGVRRFTAGLQGDELNPYASTATGVNKVEDSSQDTLDLLARNFAEQAFKPLFKRIAELTTKYQDKPATVKLRGKWINVDPSSWDTEMDATVTVGLGTGNKDRVVGQLMGMLTQVDPLIVQAQGGISGPLLTMKNVYNKVNKLVEAQGFKAADELYTDPTTAPPVQPKPDPKMAEVQGKLQLAQQQGQMKLSQQQQKAQLDAQIESEKAQRDSQRESAQMQADMASDHMHAQNQARLEQIKVQAEMAREQMKLEHELAIERIRAGHDMQLNVHKAKLDAELAKYKAKQQPKKKVSA
jgi:hypothetical protein